MTFIPVKNSIGDPGNISIFVLSFLISSYTSIFSEDSKNSGSTYKLRISKTFKEILFV